MQLGPNGEITTSFYDAPNQVSHLKESWSLKNTVFNPSAPNNSGSRLFLLSEVQESEAPETDTTATMATIAVVTLGLGLCVFARKQKEAWRADTDQFIRV